MVADSFDPVAETLRQLADEGNQEARDLYNQREDARIEAQMKEGYPHQHEAIAAALNQIQAQRRTDPVLDAVLTRNDKEIEMTTTNTTPATTTPNAESLAAVLAADITAQQAAKAARRTARTTPQPTGPAPTTLAEGRERVKRAKLTGTEIKERRELARQITGYDNTSPIWGQTTSVVVGRVLDCLRGGDQTLAMELLEQLLRREATNTLTFAKK